MDAALSNLPPIKDRLDLDYEELRSEIAAALSAVPQLDIASDEDILAARGVALSLKALQGKVDAAFKSEKAPFLEGGRQVDQYFKALRVGLDATISAITTQASAWQARKLDEARRKAAEEARVAAFLDEKPAAPPAPAAMTRVSDEGRAVISGIVRWDFEVVDIDAVPRELLQINDAAVKAKIAGLKATSKSIDDATIPGLRIFEKVQTVFRAGDIR
jgi:hypothetical protein